MKKIREFKGHTARVLHMSQSPDRTTIISASADETLRFWDLFGVARSTSNIGSKYGKLNQSTTSSSGSLIGSCGLASPVKPALNSSSVHLQIR